MEGGESKNVGKRKKRYYVNEKYKKKGNEIEFRAGIKGFLITTSKEAMAVLEAYNLLNEVNFTF